MRNVDNAIVASVGLAVNRRSSLGPPLLEIQIGKFLPARRRPLRQDLNCSSSVMTIQENVAGFVKVV